MTNITDIDQILEIRERTHGSFSENAFVAQQLKGIVRMSPNYNKFIPEQAEAIDMILHKIARAVNGDPMNLDTFADIVGYAQLAYDAMKAHLLDQSE